jgi:hypothetical protein
LPIQTTANTLSTDLVVKFGSNGQLVLLKFCLRIHEYTNGCFADPGSATSWA